jgi:transcriptional regulator with XRE-family HTH domain
MKIDDTDQLLLSLGKLVAKLRKRKNLTQAQLAELIQVEPETISRLERGVAAPSIPRVVSLAEALGVSVSELLTASSPLSSDKVALLERELRSLSKSDQDFVLDVALKLAGRFAKA